MFVGILEQAIFYLISILCSRGTLQGARRDTIILLEDMLDFAQGDHLNLFEVWQRIVLSKDCFSSSYHVSSNW